MTNNTNQCYKCGAKKDLIKTHYQKVTEGQTRYICKNCWRAPRRLKLKCNSCGEKENIAKTGRLSKTHRVTIYKCNTCRSEFTTSTKNFKRFKECKDEEQKIYNLMNKLWRDLNIGIKPNLNDNEESQWAWG